MHEDVVNQFASGPLDYITMWQHDFAAASACDSKIPFAEVFLPGVQQDTDQLLAQYQVVSAEAVDGLRRQCVQWLSDLASQPLQFLFSAARGKGRSLEEFTTEVRDNQLASVFDAFAELETVLHTARSTWLESLEEFLKRATADRSRLETTFGINSGRRILDLQTGLSDRHHGGRTVYRATWDDGKQLIYKPRSMALEERWNELLQWINATGFQPEFKVQSVVDRGHYGWVECCRPEPPVSAEEWLKYLECAGSMAALCWVLDAIDMHMANVMACDHRPVLIDVETFFQTAACSRGKSSPGIGQLGFFPRWHQIADFQIDWSGLGGFGDQPTPCRVPCWREIGSDRMRMHYVPALLKEVHLPPGRRERSEWEVTPQPRKIESLQAGYCKMMDFLRLQQNQDALRLDAVPLSDLLACSVRIVRQSTRDYYRALNVSLQLSNLRIPGGRAAAIARNLGDGASSEEIDALYLLDIPRFFTTDLEGFRHEVALRLQSIDECLMQRHAREISEAMTNAASKIK